MEETKHAGGRPSIYTKELADIICSKLAEGKSLRAVCREEEMPGLSSVFKWIRENKEFSQHYADACAERTEAQNEMMLDIGDEAIEAAHTADPKAANAVVSGYKLKADNLKWVMSKMKPKKYGDKIDMTTNGKDLPIPLLHVLDNNSNNQDKQA